VTCRHYRRGISGGLGLCGLDPRHGPVAATDVHACWTAATHSPDEAAGSPDPRPAAPSGRAPRTFVPVETLVRHVDGDAVVAVLERAAVAVAVEPGAVLDPPMDPEPEPVPVMAPAIPAPARQIPGRWWLWGDPDPWPERLGERWG
jgi:hypothetical protein